MKKALTVRVDPDLLHAARACAVREHRSLTNFIETWMRGRIEQIAAARPLNALTPQRSTRGD